MTTQQSRPSWFRLALLTNRAPTPATTTPSNPIPTRPTTPRTRPTTPAPAPSRPTTASPGVVRPMVPTRPSSVPTVTPPPPPFLAPPRSPTKPPPTSAPPQPSPLRAPHAHMARFPIQSPPPATKSPVGTSPFQKPTITTSSYAAPSPRRIEPLQKNPTLTHFAKTEHQHEPKIDQKNVMVQDKPMSKSRDYRNNTIPSIRKKEPTIKDKGTGKEVNNPEEVGMRFITLAGENKGGIMELSPSHKRNYPVGVSHILKKSVDTKSTTYNDNANRSKTIQNPSMATLNSNVQGINNSILLDCEFENTNPGIHLTLTRKTNGGFVARDKAARDN